MGCHTWSYKKVSALTYDEKQHFVYKEINSLNKWWGFKRTTQEVIDEVTEWFNDDPQELYVNETRTPEQYALDMIQEYQERLVDYLDNGFGAYIREYKSNPAKFKTINGELYINIGFDDPCRVYGYLDDEFTNVDKFLSWLKTLKPNMVGYYDENTFKFVEGYSPKLERSVRDYFEKHGKDNLFIKFG